MEETPHVDQRLAYAAYETDRTSHGLLAQAYQRLCDESHIRQNAPTSVQPGPRSGQVAAPWQEAQA